jgi:putative chitinase
MVASRSGTHMNRKAFYDRLRNSGANLTTENVAGMEFLLDKLEEKAPPLGIAANILGQIRWETAGRMQPINEYGSTAYFNRRYGPGTRVGKVLGNNSPGDGARFHGRGYVQITGRDNYKKAGTKLGHDLVANPDAALIPEIAWKIAYRGMTEGWFTGKKLSDYIDDKDEPDSEDLREYVNARRVVNGTDRAQEIARLSLQFERALFVAGYDPLYKAPPVEPVKDTVQAIPPQRENWLIALIRAIFRR